MNKAGIVHRKDTESAEGKRVFLCVSTVNYYDIFNCIAPLTLEAAPQVIVQVTPQVTEQVTEQVEKSAKIVEFCKTPKSASEIMDFLGLKHREHFRAKIIQPLLKQGLLKPTIPDKPTSPKQKYYSTKEKK